MKFEREGVREGCEGGVKFEREGVREDASID